MDRKRVIFLIIISLFIFLSLPKTSRAEIATVKDWIGFFEQGAGNTKADTVNGNSWAYTSSCSQTAPSANAVPILSRLDLLACNIPISPMPSPGQFYLFRMYGNDYNPTSDPNDTSGLIAYSKTMEIGGGSTPLYVPPSPISKLYHFTGDFHVNHNITINYTGVIFVDGDLYIGPFSPINSGLINNNVGTGLVFIVQGNIYVAPTVSRIDAFLVTEKIFCSSWNDTTSNCEDVANPTQLTINGAVVALSSDLANAPKFVRTNGLNTDPAETINFDPKYLIILKDTFARDLLYWNEIQ